MFLLLLLLHLVTPVQCVCLCVCATLFFRLWILDYAYIVLYMQTNFGVEWTE